VKERRSAEQMLELFHPVIRSWFRRSYSAPTGIQLRSWPVIATGAHVLLTAPTGSGKTLCVFLWALNQLLTEAWPSGSTGVLYVSPLKALNNDIRRNLVHPLREIRERFASEAIACPEIRIMTRSGDTPSRERQRMLRRPPEILITTPESLNLLLSSPRARENLGALRTVILDEIHAVAADKRGTHLITAVERLVLLSGEFQRLALSATIEPAEAIADWVGGYRLIGNPRVPTGPAVTGRVSERDRGDPVYEKRKVVILRSPEAAGSEDFTGRPKLIELVVRSAGSAPAKTESTEAVKQGGGRKGPPYSKASDPALSAREIFWSDLVREIKSRIRTNRSTLIFTNTRRHAEKLARLLNEQEDAQLAYAHHGSLSKEIRLVVEQKLKAGELSAIVATSSLELGIDIGALDEVLLVQTPFSVSSALQRIGRAGHGVGELSRGRLFCTHGRDLLNAAVMARSVMERDIEPVRPVEAPLDLLAQIVLSMSAVRGWQADELYEFLRSSSPYHNLLRKHYDLVLEMLAGRCADRYLRELRPRLSWDKLDGTLRAMRGVLPLVYRSGGTIPDRGYYDLRVHQNGAKIGELDEEFVWERKVGDTFNLGTQNWKILRIDSKNVEVVPWNGPVNITPFWRAEKAGRDFHYSERTALFVESCNGDLSQPARLIEELVSRHFFDEASAQNLVDFFERQRSVTGCDLPHRHNLLIEHVEGPLAQACFSRVILHTLWGSRVNFPFSLVLEAAWAMEHPGDSVEALADDDCVLIIPSNPEGFSVDELLSLVRPEEIEVHLRRSLEGSGFFGARFRENAARALLLPRSNLDRRIPLWLTRLRAKKLLEGISPCGEFPILLETWRSCLQDEFDLPALESVLAELQSGRIRRSVAKTSSPSPFAENISWIQTNDHMYRGEATRTGGSAVQKDVIREILYSRRLRPRIAPELAAELQAKLQRITPGYSPTTPEELLDWLKERVLVEDEQWRELVEAVRGERDPSSHPEGPVAEKIAGKVVRYRLPRAQTWMVSALEQMPKILRSVAAVGGWNPDELAGSLELDEEGFSPVSGKQLRSILAAAEADHAEKEHHLSALVAEWLRYYGPLPLARISAGFGLTPAGVESLLDELAENGTVVVDQLTRGSSILQVCDAQNLEILLRLTRRGSRPSLAASNPEQLPLFLALVQGLADRETRREASSVEGLRRVLESLFGFPAPLRLWEQEIFPARLRPYHASWLDELLRSSELQWFGCGRQRIAFSFASDLELFLESGDPEADEKRRRLLPSPRGKYSFWDLVDHSGSTPSDTTRQIWELVWEGALACDSFAVLRKAATGGFQLGERRPEGLKPGKRRAGRGSYDRWRAAHPLAGSWYGIEGAPAADLLEEEELARGRVRQLLQRYGILFRELVARELEPLQWSRIFRTLRLMELSGEILSGYFFEGIPGVQFISHRGYRLLREGLPDEAIFWISAADPASVCGLGLPISGLPSRLASNHLVYHGSRLVLVSRRGAAEVELRVSPEDSALPEYLRVFSDLLDRDVAPRKTVRVERINGLEARQSPYKEVFLKHGFLDEYRGMILRAAY
jgi:ATP-dependent Lhr-like helicase